MQLYNENDILAKLRSNNADTQKEAFNQVVRYYSEKLYWHVRKMVLSHDDTNDIVQNTFIKAWLNIDLFRGEAKLSTWLYKIAINESVNFLKKQRTQNHISIDDSDVFLLDKLPGDEYFDGDALQLKLQRAILTLPEKQRLVFNMRYYDELPYEEISEILSTSVGALKASYHHAYKKIENFFTEEH